MQRFPGLAVLALAALLSAPASAQTTAGQTTAGQTNAGQTDGLVTVPSPHPPRATLDRFEAAVRQAGWVVFTEIDHAAAASAVGMELAPRTVVLFGNPRAGTPGMMAKPTLALDLPLRVLIWQDGEGRTFVTRSTGADLAQRVFARHGVTVPPEGQANTESFLGGLVAKAVE